MTVAELRLRMSTHEFYQWVAFYNVEAKLAEQEARKQKAKMAVPRGRR